MLIRCEMLKKLANAFIEVAKEENLRAWGYYIFMPLPVLFC